MIGHTHNSGAASGADPYTMYHWTQWSTTVTPAAGNILQAWVSYLNWDSLASNTTNTTSYLNTQATATFTNATAAGITYVRTSGDNFLGNITGTSSTIRGDYASSTASQTGISLTAGWTAATSTTLARLNLAMSQTFKGDPEVKVGDSVQYVSGW